VREPRTLADLQMDPLEEKHYRESVLDPRANPNGEFGEYTPDAFISYSDERCRHKLRGTVPAPRADCLALVNDWERMPHCFDLIDTVRTRLRVCVCNLWKCCGIGAGGPTLRV
jgi:hypothetical protein